ncbi:type II secretion system protein GspC [Alginatibacterium sediminis]|nr:type II secretion system protein GspC [Alginatibacterium sediminis]
MQKIDFSDQLNRLALSTQLSRWIFLVLLISGAWIVGRSASLLLPQEPSRGLITSHTGSLVQSPLSEGQSMDSVIALHLFGEEKSSSTVIKQVSSEAPTTQLNLRLSGLVYSTDPSRASALIDSKGKEQSYRSGESIIGTQAKLVEVQLDRVIISHRGKNESLLLDPPKSKNSSKTPARQSNNTNRSTRTKVAEIASTPGKLSDYIRISPVQQDGEVRGYRVNAGKQQQFFEESGLQANDLAIAINGYDLTDKEQAMQIMQELPLLVDATVTVEREGQLEDIYVQLPQE